MKNKKVSVWDLPYQYGNFWDGKSKGTKHTIGLTQKMGKECKIINV